MGDKRDDKIFALFDEVMEHFHYKESESTKWKKILSENLYDTLSSIDEVTSEDWEAMELPFKVLIELKKRYTPPNKKIPSHQFVTKKVSLDGLRGKEQSFQDLSQFIRSTRTLSEDVKQKKDRKWKTKSKKPQPMSLKKLTTHVNIVGREGHPFLLISTFFGGGLSEDNPPKLYNTTLSIYGYDVTIDIYDCAVANSEAPDSIVIVFARENLGSLHKMLEKWIQTKEKTKIPIVLASIDTNRKNSKFVSIEHANNFLQEFNGIRYLEISTQEEAKELFVEIAKIKIRAEEAQPKDVSLKIQKIFDKKKEEAVLRKQGLSLLPNSIYCVTPFVQKLRLECNLFKFFPLEVFLFHQLQELNLSMNQLEDIPPDIACLTHLLKLDVENNALESLPLSSIQSLKNLVELKTKGNPLSKLPEELKGKSLDLLPAIRAFTVKEESELDLRSFGVPLKSLLIVEKKLYHLRSVPDLPKIALKSINFLLKFGVQMEGIFRMAGQNVRCVELKESIDSGIIKFSDSENPHDVSNVFKQWLRELPEPVFLFSNFNRVLSLAKLSEEEKIKELKTILQELPAENFQLLKQIFRVMYIVGINAEANRMDFSNITKVVCPNLLYSKTPHHDPFKTMSDITTINDVLLNITQNFPSYFEENVNLLQTESLLPDKPIAVFYRRIFGHTKSIMATAISSDSKLLWSVDSRGFIKIWAVPALELVQTIDTKKRRINCIVNHSKKMWIGTIDGLEVRDENSGDHLADLSSLSAFTITTTASHVWVGDARAHHIYHVEDYKCVDVEVASEPLTLITSGGTVWGACRDNKIRVWNAETFALVTEFDTKHESKVSSIAEIEGNVWSWDNSAIFVWDKEFRQISSFEKTQKVFGAKVILNKTWAFSWKGDINLYDPANFEHKGEVFTYHNDAISSIEVIYDDHLKCHKVFTASWDKSIICWLLDSPDRKKKKEGSRRKRRVTPTSLPAIHQVAFKE